MDATDFGSLIERCYPRIRRAALLMTGNDADAEDLAQETFLQAMQSWKRFDHRAAVQTWLYSILLNLDRKRRRGYGRGWRRMLRWLDRRPHEETPGPRIALELDESRESLWTAVSRLPDVQCQAIVLRYAEGLTNDEVAAVMACPVGTVKSRIHHGLVTLRRNIDGSQHDIENGVREASVCGD